MLKCKLTAIADTASCLNSNDVSRFWALHFIRARSQVAKLSMPWSMLAANVEFTSQMSPADATGSERLQAECLAQVALAGMLADTLTM